MCMHNSDDGLAATEDQQQQNLSEDSAVEMALGSGISKNLMNDDDLKASYVKDVSVCLSLLAVNCISCVQFLSCDMRFLVKYGYNFRLKRKVYLFY